MGKSEIAEIAEIATSRDINLKKRYFQRNNFEGIVHRNLFLGIEILKTSCFAKHPRIPHSAS
jgi:hypothetical protein